MPAPTKIKKVSSDRFIQAVKEADSQPDHTAMFAIPVGYVIMHVVKPGDTEMVLHLLGKQEISIRKGAQLLGVTYREMLDLMAKHDVALLDYAPGELEAEVRNLNKVLGKNVK